MFGLIQFVFMIHLYQ